MNCFHTHTHLMFSKDKSSIFRVCAYCRLLMDVFDSQGISMYIPYIAPHYEFQKCFNLVVTDLYYKNELPLLRADSTDATEPIIKNEQRIKKPLFFTSLSKEEYTC